MNEKEREPRAAVAILERRLSAGLRRAVGAPACSRLKAYENGMTFEMKDQANMDGHAAAQSRSQTGAPF
jgi:hypothetical protein